MSGASDSTQRVSYVNANWTASTSGGTGSFELMVVTEDEQRHSLPVAPEEMAAVVALTQASGVMLFDPEAGTLIAANLAGEWLPATWRAGQPRTAGRPHGG